MCCRKYWNSMFHLSIGMKPALNYVSLGIGCTSCKAAIPYGNLPKLSRPFPFAVFPKTINVHSLICLSM